MPAAPTGEEHRLKVINSPTNSSWPKPSPGLAVEAERSARPTRSPASVNAFGKGMAPSRQRFAEEPNDARDDLHRNPADSPSIRASALEVFLKKRGVTAAKCEAQGVPIPSNAPDPIPVRDLLLVAFAILAGRFAATLKVTTGSPVPASRCKAWRDRRGLDPLETGRRMH